MDKAIAMNLVDSRPCVTKKFHIHGYKKNPNLKDHMYVYGSDQDAILKLITENPEYGKRLSDKYDYTVAEVVWAVQGRNGQRGGRCSCSKGSLVVC